MSYVILMATSLSSFSDTVYSKKLSMEALFSFTSSGLHDSIINTLLFSE